MMDRISKLYGSIQAMKNPREPIEGAHWYVLETEENRYDGPYHAVEIAYLIYTGGIRKWESVFDFSAKEGYLIEEHPFLSHWLVDGIRKEDRLRRGLEKCASQYRAALGLRREDKPSADLLRAFRILDLGLETTPSEVKRRRRKLAVIHHPDKGGCNRTMQEINWAYTVVQRSVCM